MGGAAVKKKRFLCLLLTAALCLGGCVPRQDAGIRGQLVTQMVITEETSQKFTRRFYNTNEKMQLILLYIRSLGPKFTPEENPEALQGQTICIHMQCADGTQKIYRQKDQAYFQEGTGPWRRIDPERGSQLWRILIHTPSDPEPDRLRHSSLPRVTGGWQDKTAIWRIRPG